jgi:hypothetical protein
MTANKMSTKVSFEAIVNSDVYTFIIGPEQKEYTAVHSAVISQISGPFAAMFRSGMKESTEKRVVLDDVDPATFGLFLEYAYTKSYHPPAAVFNKDPDTGFEVGSIDPCDTSNCRRFCVYCGSDYAWSRDCRAFCPNVPAVTMKNRHRTFCRSCGLRVSDSAEVTTHGMFVVGARDCKDCRMLKDMRKFPQRTYPVHGRSGADFEDYLNGMSDEDLTPSDICHHARLYIFATKWMVTDLQELCLHRVRRELSNRQLTESVVQHICDTIREVYETTSAASGGSGGIGSGLRHLLVDYAFCFQDSLLNTFDAFQALLLEGGDFLSDFARRNLEAEAKVRAERAARNKKNSATEDK